MLRRRRYREECPLHRFMSAISVNFLRWKGVLQNHIFSVRGKPCIYMAKANLVTQIPLYFLEKSKNKIHVRKGFISSISLTNY